MIVNQPYYDVLSTDPNKPYLLLVHGFMSSKGQWVANTDALLAICNPVVLDLLGHGRSPSPDDPACYTPDAYIQAFEVCRTELGVAQWMVCGQSFGAGLTMQYALKHPDRIVCQMLTNSVSGFISGGRTPGSSNREELIARLRQHGQAAIDDMPWHPRNGKRLVPSVAQALIDDAAMLNAKGLANGLEYTVPLLSASDRFSDTSVPTLLVNGMRERAFQPVARHALELLPALEVIELDGGHSINAENPADFNTALSQYIKRYAKRIDRLIATQYSQLR